MWHVCHLWYAFLLSGQTELTSEDWSGRPHSSTCMHCNPRLTIVINLCMIMEWLYNPTLRPFQGSPGWWLPGVMAKSLKVSLQWQLVDLSRTGVTLSDPILLRPIMSIRPMARVNRWLATHINSKLAWSIWFSVWRARKDCAAHVVFLTGAEASYQGVLPTAPWSALNNQTLAANAYYIMG